MDRSPNQACEAQIFGVSYEERLNLVGDKLLQAVPVLTDRCVEHAQSNTVLADLLDKVRALKDAKDIKGLFSVLRWNASVFTPIQGFSNLYWEWIDGYGSFSDATSEHWPYLTQDRRERYLTWAEESADKLLALAQ